eukprot:9578184-Lingulodinium_polyedra.AAC.1
MPGATGSCVAHAPSDGAYATWPSTPALPWPGTPNGSAWRSCSPRTRWPWHTRPRAGPCRRSAATT